MIWVIVYTKEPFHKLVNQGMILGTNNEKMSKSRGNVINPDEIVRNLVQIRFVCTKCLWGRWKRLNLGTRMGGRNLSFPGPCMAFVR